MARTADEEARAFWRETLGEHPTPEQIERELHDFYVVIQEVPKVYLELTGGRFSKPTTMAAYIIDRVNEREAEAVAEAAAEATLPLRERIAEMETEIAVLRAVEATARRALADVRERGWWSKATRALVYALDKVEHPDRVHLPVPAWVFEEKQHADGPAHFLLALKPDGTFPSIDGAHDDPEGVAMARKRYQSIGIITPAEGTRYLMLTVQAAPEPGGEVNQDAIDTLNRISR